MTKGPVGETLQKRQQQAIEAETKRCQEIDKKEREYWKLHRLKMLKYPLERH